MNASPIEAAGSVESAEGDEPAAYAQGLKLVQHGKFDQARAAFVRANRAKSHDPEILNMLAYAQRKTGDLEEAIKNYHRALRLRPDFPDAREYLGEAYVQAALAQLAQLADAGPEAKRQHDLLVKAIHEAASGLGPVPSAARW